MTRTLFNRILLGLLFSLVIVWILYIFLGHELIETVYKSQNNSLFTKIMTGKNVTRLEDYYHAADTRMMALTGHGLLLILIMAALINSPLGTLISAVSLVLTSITLFSFFELFPSLIKPLHLDIFGYFAYKSTYLPDPTLIYVEKPNNYQITHYFRGHAYSPLLGIPVTPTTLEWKTDSQGFRNDRTHSSGDVVVMGDSYIEYGSNVADTFGKRLEAKLPGLTVVNLGKAGYNPFQYLEVFKRYGIQKNPKYALFCFYEGNDIREMQAYINWQRGQGDYNVTYTLGSKTFFERYRFAVGGVLRLVQELISTQTQLIVQRILYKEPPIHQEVAVFRLPNGDRHKVFVIPRLGMAAPQEMLRSEEWIALKRTLIGFKQMSIKHNIVPIIVYIPTVTHIYAEYSSDDSGTKWLGELKNQISAKTNTETAMSIIAQEISIQMLSLSPPFEQAASAGTLLYYATDSHWNSNGRELAAQFVARRLTSGGLIPKPHQAASQNTMQTSTLGQRSNPQGKGQ